MSVKRDSEGRIKVYVRLLEEGTDVSRPTEAYQVGDHIYKLLPTQHYDSLDEKWEFPPGSLVRLERRQGSVGEYLLAVKI
jgi:hypothetical protein